MASPAPPAPTTNPLSGILSGGTTGRLNMTWENLTGHERAVAWGQINDVFEQILGRQATKADAKKFYNMGISNYALGQQLMMSKEFRHTSIFAQLQRGYQYELAQFVGGSFKLSPKLAQSFAAHNYSTTDIQAWVYRHPHIYTRSNDFQTRVSQMKDVYGQVMGVDPYAGAPTVGKRIDTNKKKKGIQGNEYVNVQDPLLAHLHQAALHFQTPDQYKAWLMSSSAYKNKVRSSIAAPSSQPDAGLTLDSRGRPIQQGLADGLNKSTMGSDVGAGGAGTSV
jgi:hypothetical protein